MSRNANCLCWLISSPAPKDSKSRTWIKDSLKSKLPSGKRKSRTRKSQGFPCSQFSACLRSVERWLGATSSLAALPGCAWLLVIPPVLPNHFHFLGSNLCSANSDKCLWWLQVECHSSSQTWRASPIFTFASAHHLHNRVQPWPLLISTQNHKHDSPMFSFTLFQKKWSLRSSETGGSLVILTLAPKRPSTPLQATVGSLDWHPQDHPADARSPCGSWSWPATSEGFAELWGTRHSRRHTPDGSELSTFFLDPRRPLHQSFTYEPKQILWDLKSKPLGTAQSSTAWFVAFYDPWIPWILLLSHVVICYRLEWLEEAPKITLHWRKHNDTLFRDSPVISRRLLSTVRIHGVPCGPFFHELIPSLYHHCLFTMHKAG